MKKINGGVKIRSGGGGLQKVQKNKRPPLLFSPKEYTNVKDNAQYLFDPVLL